MRNRVSWTIACAVALCAITGMSAMATAGTDRTAREARAHPSKQGLANSYKPSQVNGQPWYRGHEAALIKNRRIGDGARPIVLMRILGDLDGGT